MKRTYIHVRSFRLSGLYTKVTGGGGGGVANPLHGHISNPFSFSLENRFDFGLKPVFP